MRPRQATPRANPAATIALASRSGQPDRQRRAAETAQAFRFLLSAGFDHRVLEDAQAIANRAAVPLHRALVTSGFVTDEAYAARVGRMAGLDVIGFTARVRFDAGTIAGAGAVLHPATISGIAVLISAADSVVPQRLWELAAIANREGRRLLLMPRRAYLDALERSKREEAEQRAIHSLQRARPDLSAASRAPTWQLMTISMLIGTVVGGALVFPGWTLTAFLLALTIPFMAVVAVRCVALVEVAFPSRVSERLADMADEDLPTYSVLVPVFDEADVIQPLINSLGRLDYPAAKLEIVLVLEEVDLTTKAALLGMRLPGNMRAVVVPDSQPRTKPKALNYAMQFASGDFVVVFDAEDRPDPDQLRRAVAMFRAGPANLACVQARLNIYNARESWFTRGIMAQTPLEVNPASP